MKHWNAKILIPIVSIILTAVAFGQNQTSETPQFNPRLVALESSKDPQKQTIVFKMASSEDPDKFVLVEYKQDANQINRIADLRQELVARQEETQARMVFMREYLNLGPQASEEKVLSHLFAMPREEEKKMLEAYEQKQKTTAPFSADAFRNYLKVYFKLPAEMSGEDAQKIFLAQGPDMRKEVERLFALKTDSVRKIAKESFKVTFSSSPHGFLSQTALFGIAQGAIMFLECQKQMAYNPLCKDQMVKGFTDPIGQVAFASFIVANKFTSDMIEKKFGGVATPSAAKMRMAMPYLGLSAGMLASNLTAEVLNLMSTCAKALMAPKEIKPSGPDRQVDPCQAAQDEFFNFNNKVEQYVPMLISMASSTYMLVKGMGAIQTIKHGSQIAANSKIGQMISGTTFAKALSKAAQPSLRVIGITLAIRVSPTGWLLNGMSVGTIAFQITQNTAFLKLDHVFIPFINKAWGQFWRGRLVKNSDEEVKNILLLKQKSGWDSAGGDMKQALKTFSENMEAWRTINHSKIFVGLQAWSEITVNLIKEMQATELFYNFYMTRVFDSYKYNEKAKSAQGLDGDEKNKATHLAFRQYPLYGVKPTGHAACENEVSEEWCVTILELYMNHPQKMEAFQKRTIRNEVKNLKTLISNLEKGELQKPSLDFIQQLLLELEVQDSVKVGEALDRLNRTLVKKELKDQNALILLNHFRTQIGNPMPSWTRGGLLPAFFEASVKDLKIFDELRVPGNVFGPRTYVEYLIYQMLCGPNATSEQEKIVESSSGWAPKFNPPRLVMSSQILVQLPKTVKNKAGTKTTALCNPVASGLTFDDLYQSYLSDSNYTESASVFSYLSQNLIPAALGNWTNIDRNSSTTFLGWWNKSTKKAMEISFKRMDQEFQQLLVGMANSLNNESFSDSAEWFDDVAETKTEVDPAGLFKLGHASRALGKSHIQEMNVYLSVLADIENSLDSKNYHSRKLNLDSRLGLLQQMTMPVYARIQSQKELLKYLSYTTTAISGMKVVNGVATMPVSAKDFNQVHDSMLLALTDYKKHLEGLKLSESQKETATFAFDSLEKAALHMSVYVFNTQLTNFSATQDYKTYMQNSDRIREAMAGKRKVKDQKSAYGH